MAESSPGPLVRIIGSRELHQRFTAIIRELAAGDARYVVTVHGRPKAVLIGAAAFLGLTRGEAAASEALLRLQLSAMLGTPCDHGLDLLDGSYSTAVDGFG